MRDDGNIVCRGLRRDLDQLGQTAEPHDVGLDNIDSAVLDQFAETVFRVLVFTSCKLDVRESLFELDVPVKVVRVENLFPPVDLDAGLLDGLGGVSGESHNMYRCRSNNKLDTHPDKSNSIRHVQAHITIHLQRVVGTNRITALFEVFDILANTLVSIRRTVRESDLASPETELFGDFGLGAGEVEGNVLFGTAANHLVYGLATDLAEEIPDGEVDDGESGEGETWSVGI